MLAALPFGAMIYGMIKTGFDLRIRKIVLSFPNLPDGFEGFRFVQISDIHSGSFIHESYFEEAFRSIQTLNPDAIFFTGDLVNNTAEEAERFHKTWAALSAPMGVFSTLGNHDYGDYVVWPSEEEKASNLERLIKVHEKAGWTLLRNQHHVLKRNGSEIALLGVENWGASMRFPKKGDVKKASAGLKNLPFRILLSHDPSHWDALVRPQHPEIDLMLSGHTHGMQFGIEIPGFKWSPSKYFYKQWGGAYRENRQVLYVNRGLGFLGYPGRVGIQPEITEITLIKGEISVREDA
jgi:predicted MPP superfamily phosphohydrolase